MDTLDDTPNGKPFFGQEDRKRKAIAVEDEARNLTRLRFYRMENRHRLLNQQTPLTIPGLIKHEDYYPSSSSFNVGNLHVDHQPSNDNNSIDDDDDEIDVSLSLAPPGSRHRNKKNKTARIPSTSATTTTLPQYPNEENDDKRSPSSSSRSGTTSTTTTLPQDDPAPAAEPAPAPEPEPEPEPEPAAEPAPAPAEAPVWNIIKTLTETDVSHGQNRLLIEKRNGHHITDHIREEDRNKVIMGKGYPITVYDADERGEFQGLKVKCWGSTKAIVINGKWKESFVIRRQLKQGDIVRLRWDVENHRLVFSCLYRAEPPPAILQNHAN